MPIDALTLVSKVIDRAMQKSGHLVSSSSGGVDDGERADLLAEALASYLLQFLGVGPSATGLQGHPPTSDLERICAEQSVRNSAVARALGACDCWGELPTCEVCRGRGVPGWRPPERVSFDLLVRPVLRKMKQQRLRTRGAVETRF